MFIIHFGLALLGVFVLGGFLVIIQKAREYYDDRFLDDKIGGWMSKQEYIFVQIFPPTENIRSLSEMEAFFINLHSVFSGKSKKDVYLKGKWYEPFVFEIHSRGGQIGFFCKMNKNYLPLFRSSLVAHYPGTGIIESPDPIGHWPKEWEGKVGPYTYCYGTDIQIAGKPHFPLKSWRAFQRTTEAPVNDPINVLISSMEDIEQGDYIVLQYILTPHTDPKKVSEWKESLKKLKHEFATNAQVETTDAGQVNVLTRQERDIIDSVETKINSNNYKTKIRLLLLSDKPAPQRLLSRVMNFFKEYQTENQFMKPAKLTKTNIEDDGEGYGIFGLQMAQILDKHYWKREQKYRLKLAYKAAIKRSGSRGIKPTYLSTDNLAALFHFPTTHMDTTNSLINKANADYQTGTSVVQGGLPPANLPT
jgi:hypothetical protein